MMADITLDARGLQCPFPVLKARKVLKDMKPGQILEVLATDPGAMADFGAFCDAMGCELIESSQKKDVFRFRIKAAEKT